MKSIPELSEDTKIIEHELDQLEPGQTIEYTALSTAIGRDVRQHARGNIGSARRRLRKEKRKVFGCVSRVGIKRLTDAEIVVASGSDITSVKRRTRNALHSLSCAEFDNLTSDEQNDHRTRFCVLGALELFSKPSATRKIEDKIKETSEGLPIGKTLKLFGS